ncbi:MAG: DUF6019 family protein [Bariatricus sp.]|nr:DUF6019 family protein [Bariatricus sp.]
MFEELGISFGTALIVLLPKGVLCVLNTDEKSHKKK